jgi:L-serine deaminase
VNVMMRVIATMRQTGAEMQSKYKETSLGDWR